MKSVCKLIKSSKSGKIKESQHYLIVHDDAIHSTFVDQERKSGENKRIVNSRLKELYSASIVSFLCYFSLFSGDSLCLEIILCLVYTSDNNLQDKIPPVFQ